MIVGKKLYRVQAWGASDLPDVDYETDECPYGLGEKYPFVHVTRQRAIQLDVLKAYFL